MDRFGRLQRMGLLLEDRSLEMVLRERLWSDFRGRITLGLADLLGEAFGGVTAGALLLPQAMGYGIISGSGTRGRRRDGQGPRLA